MTLSATLRALSTFCVQSDWRAYTGKFPVPSGITVVQALALVREALKGSSPQSGIALRAHPSEPIRTDLTPVATIEVLAMYPRGMTDLNVLEHFKSTMKDCALALPPCHLEPSFGQWRPPPLPPHEDGMPFVYMRDTL